MQTWQDVSIKPNRNIYGGFYKLLCSDFEDFVSQIDDLNEGAVRALWLNESQQDDDKNSKARKRLKTNSYLKKIKSGNL